MADLDEVPHKRTRSRVLTARVSDADHKRINGLIKAAGATQDGFVRDAVAEKLERGKIDTTDIGPLRDLDIADRNRVTDIADLLRAFGDSEYPLLRVAVDNQIKLLYAIVGQR